MPRKAKEWSESQVKRAVHSGGPGHYVAAVGGVQGLCLQISPTGHKSWILRYSFAGKRREMGLGPYGPFCDLKFARRVGGEARAMLMEVPPRDPIEVRQSAVKEAKAAVARKMTFQQAAEAALAQRADSFRDEKAKAAWYAPLVVHGFPAIGGMPVAAVTMLDVVRVLEPIWLAKQRTASILRARLESVMAWAIANEKRPAPNPAEWNDTLKHRLPAAPKRDKQASARPAVQVKEAARWYAAVAAMPAPAARALQVVALTAMRSGEVRGMRWDELDMDRLVWSIPAERMKMKKAHDVPLSSQVAAIIEAQRREVASGLHKGSPLVFPAARGGMLSDLMISDLMKQVHAADVKAGNGGFLDAHSKRPAVPHGLRSTFKGWAQEARVDWDLSELALAHELGNEVAQAYNRANLLEARRPVMQAWAQFAAGTLT